MAKCDLRINLDKQDRTYAIGEKVTGEVVVIVDQTCKCKKLTLTREWQTSGKGNTAKGGAQEQILFEGEWEKGDQFSYVFEFDAPPGPVTHRGMHFNVHWMLRARADIPWAIDPKAEENIHLIRGSHDGQIDLGTTYKPPDQKLQQLRTGMGILGFVAVVFLVLGGYFLMNWIRLLAEGFGFISIQTLLGAGLFHLGLVCGFFAARNWMAGRKIGPLDVQIEPTLIHRGSSLTCRIGFQPTGALLITEVKATLQAKEWVVRGSGKHTSHFHNKPFERALSLAANQSFPGNQPASLETVIEIPADVPSTFVAPSNQLAWTLTLHFDIPKWPDYKQAFPITILP